MSSASAVPSPSASPDGSNDAVKQSEDEDMLDMEFSDDEDEAAEQQKKAKAAAERK